MNYKLIGILTIIFIGIGVVFSLIYSPALKIDNFSVKGNDVLLEEKIVENIKKYKSENIIFVNTENIKDTLVEKENYIKDIAINKIYPNKLEIKVLERKPLAKIVNDNKILVFDKEGYILEESENDIDIKVPLIKGVGYSFSKNKIVFTPSFEKLVHELEDLKSPLINDLNLIQYEKSQNNRYKIKILILNNNIEVKLGEVENLAKKFSILEATILRIEKENLAIDYINLEYPEKPVYKTEN
ncbi:MAG: cell division protein FtsQ/DivIB [Bacillota bacterium]